MPSTGSRSTASVLAELRWDDGYAVPVANAENKALEDDLQKMEKEKANLQNQLADFEERIKAMVSHLKNVRQEFSFTQSLYKARENEIETERHFKALAERERGRLKSEIKRLEDEIVSLREKKNSRENAINKTTKKLESLKQQMSCDEEVLESWIKESDRKDNDIITIQKYAQQDEGKLGALILQVEKLSMQANQKRRALDNELTETMTAQLLAELKQEMRKKESVLKEKASFLVNETINNMEYEKKISSAERESASLRKEYQTQDTYRVQLENELDILKSAVDRTASDLESLRIHVTNVKKEIEEKKVRLSFLKERNAGLSSKLKLVTEKTLSSEDNALRMEEMLREEERTVKEKETELNHLKEAFFKKTHELKVQKDKEKCVLAEIEGSRTSLKNLHSRLRRLDADALKQQELIYNQDFYIQQAQRRLSRLEGEVNADEKQALEEKVAELKKALEEKRSTYDTLNAQHKKLQTRIHDYISVALQNDVHFIKRAMDKTGEEANGLMIKINELNLFNEKSGQELKKAKAVKQERMIEDNLLKLELKRLQDILCNKTEKVLTLEKQKLELKKSIAERTEEIKIHKAMLDSQIRLVDQERHRISAAPRTATTSNCKNKSSCATDHLLAPTKLVGSQNTQSNCTAPLAQLEPAELIKSITMSNYLTYVSSAGSGNSEYKITVFHKASEEYEEKLKLEEEKRVADEKYRYKRRQVRELQEYLQSMEKNLDALLKQEAIFQEQNKEKEAVILQLNKDIEEQKPKLERVIKQCSRLSREIQSLKKTKTETHEEKDIDLRALKTFSKTINKLLVEVLNAHPDLTASFQKYFHQFNLELPTVASGGGGQSSPSPSTQSSLSSRRSSRSTNSGSSQTSLLKVINLNLSVNIPAEAASSSPPSSRTSNSDN
ncbi:hypothetical protein ASZ78_016553 [Callipepla squamata]|uniref:Coiled-coil domain-containing protein 39 n=1 Tax=Callipepla squamata TaxID=9009 RepID=A0A226MZQ7_CALSU|nr:hypothetical protein ASZ78_016553 [Callipepla squamata]